MDAMQQVLIKTQLSTSEFKKTRIVFTLCVNYTFATYNLISPSESPWPCRIRRPTFPRPACPPHRLRFAMHIVCGGHAACSNRQPHAPSIRPSLARPRPPIVLNGSRHRRALSSRISASISANNAAKGTRVDPSDVEVKNVLGEGSFGTVFEVPECAFRSKINPFLQWVIFSPNRFH